MRETYSGIDLDIEGEQIIEELEKLFPYIDITRSKHGGKLRAIQFKGEIRSEKQTPKKR